MTTLYQSLFIIGISTVSLFAQTTMRGGCLFPYDDREKIFVAAKDYNMNVLRFNCGDDEPNASPEKGFLIGKTDTYTGLVAKDLKLVDSLSSWCQQAKVTMILESHHLPGRNWYADDSIQAKISTDFSYHAMAAQYWKDLAIHYKGQPMLFELLNESKGLAAYIENNVGWNSIETDPDIDVITPASNALLREKMKNDPANLNILYKTIISAIREVDSTRKIIIEPDMWAQGECFELLDPIKKPDGTLDTNVNYAFHYYSPSYFTGSEEVSDNSFPGMLHWTNYENRPDSTVWNKEVMRKTFTRIEAWRIANGIPARHIWCTEFGVTRWSIGAERWLDAVASLLEEYGYQWTFYAFREDAWNGFDPEVGSAMKKAVRDRNSPQMQVLDKRFKLNKRN